jgi:tRNA-2-methylthio-N6-dimethylallyladenosine synthase
MVENSKKVFIKNFGCQMNVRDSEVVCGLLRKADYQLTQDSEDADIIIFNTCSVRQHAEDKVWSGIGNVVKKSGKVHKAAKSQGRKKPIIGIIGCMAQNYRDQIFERAPEVDFVVGPSDIDKIPAILARIIDHKPQAADRQIYQLKIWETDGQLRPENIYHTGFHEEKEHSYVVISEGCSNYCSYCVVPYVRGELHNREFKDILQEIESSVKSGITKITLLGQNVNAYKSGSVNFVKLVNSVDRVEGLKEFSFLTSHPRDTSEVLFEAMAECDKLKKNLHLPVQSGSDKVLKSMNRGYTRKFYLDLADNYRKIVKGGTLTTDIIVGFSGETKDDFQQTFDLVKYVGFDAAYIFKYSPRPNTEALKWPDDVPKEEKEHRHAVILDLQKTISKGKNAKI